MFAARALLPINLATAEGVSARSDEQRAQAPALCDALDDFTELLSVLDEAWTVVDLATGKFLYANDQATRLFGCRLDELLASDPITLSPANQPDGSESSEALKRFMGQAIDRRTASFPWVHATRSGVQIPCDVTFVGVVLDWAPVVFARLRPRVRKF